MKRRDALKSIGLAMAALAITPGAAHAGRSAFDLALQGQSLLAAQNPAQAVAVLQEAVTLDPKNPWIFGLLGRAWLAGGEDPQALAAFRRAAQLDKNDEYSAMMVSYLEQNHTQPTPSPSSPNQRMKLAPQTPLERLAEEERRALDAMEQQGNSKAQKGFRIQRIVLDPGHGGFDPGAVGVDGVQEKELALLLARETAQALETGWPHLRVFLTRTDDYFVPLADRTAMANQYAADLFVSLHLNAFGAQSPSGVETYFCSEKASSKEAQRVMEQENAARDLEQHTDMAARFINLEDILFRFERRRYWKAGGRSARRLQQGLAQALPLRNRGVHSANFYVLRNARMPALLLEAGFISNPEDAFMLGDPWGRAQVAGSIAENIGAMSAAGV